MAAAKGKGGATGARARSSISPTPPTMTRDMAKRATTDLPPTRRADPRTSRYAEAMAEVRQLAKAGKIKRGAWVPIASFSSKRGAREVANALDRGDRPVDGARDDWDIEARREVMATGKLGSILYVRLRK